MSFSPSSSIDSALIEADWYQQKSPEFNKNQVNVYMNMNEQFNSLKTSHLKTFGCPIRFEYGLIKYYANKFKLVHAAQLLMVVYLISLNQYTYLWYFKTV